MDLNLIPTYVKMMAPNLALQNTNMNLWGPMRFEDLQTSLCSKKTAGGNNSALGIRNASLEL